MTLRSRAALILGAWLLALAGAGLLVQRGLVVATDLRSFMPPPRNPDQKLLTDEIGDGPGSRLLLIALSGESDARLAAISQALAQSLRADANFAGVFNGDTELGALDVALLPYRYLLSPTLDNAVFDAEFLRDEFEQRVEDLGSPAATWLKPLLARDPTLEVLKLAQRWAPPRTPETRDGVWFSAQGEALLLAQTRAAGFDPGAQGSALAALDRGFRSAAGAGPAQIAISGPGFFAAEVNARTRAEADWIGGLSSVGFVLLMLLAYRSVVVIGIVALPLASGALAGVAALALGFGQAHAITLAFGFTLLGVAQEYPIRLLSHRCAGKSAAASMRALWPLLLTAIASACIAYLAFFASGVTGLQQLAVFTIVGLLVAGGATRYVLPQLLPTRFRDAADTPGLGRIWNWLEGLPRPRWLPPILVMVGLLALWVAPAPFWQDDLAALTPLSHDLLERDGRLRSALGAPDVRYLLVLDAPTQDALLTLSESIAPPLDAIVASGAVDAVELPSRYLPSLATQRARQARLPGRAALEATLASVLRDLPFRPNLFAPFVADVELARTLPPLDARTFAQAPLGARLQAMLRKRGDGWLGLATLTGVHDPSALEGLAAQTTGHVHLLDLKATSESLVIAYRARIVRALGAASLLLAMTVALALRNARRAWHVLAPMALATLLVVAVLRTCGVALSLFHLIALTLAAGLGLHYALFFERVVADAREARRTLHGTVVCCASALLVFGVLACASIPVLRAIGLTVGLGVGFHFTLSILMARDRRETGY